MRKVAGYTAPTSTPYCTNCKGLYSEINNLEWGDLRNGSEVRQQSQAWKEAETIIKKEELAKEYGVRWTPFYDMPWWDPVRHITLGWLHCWQEGVLQFHLRILWGFEMTGDEDFGDVDPQDLADELADLQQEQAEFDASQASDATPPPTSESEMDEAGTAQATSSTQPLYFTLDEDDRDWVENEGGDVENATDSFPTAFDFPEDHRAEFLADLWHILLPSFIARPPINLGDPGHGKLKGDELLTLFNYMFSLSVPKLWWRKGNTFWASLLKNFHHLAGSSNIIASFTTSSAKGHQYNTEYLAYLQGVQTLFPLWNLVPNHHFALHYGDLMSFWGPIPGLSDAKGEEVNGILQRFPTSRRLADMPYTMMKSFLRRTRLEAKVFDAQFTDQALQNLASILDSRCAPNSPSVPRRTVSPVEEARFFQIGTILPESDYTVILQYLQSLGQNWSSFYDFPQPPGAPVFAHAGRNCKHLTLRKRTYSTLASNEADSHIQFAHPATGIRDTGYIEAIWELGLGGAIQPFILVRQHKALDPSEEALGPYLTYPNFRCRLVGAAQSDVLIVLEPPHIITHLSVLKLNTGVFGLQRKSMVVCWALDRGREE
ncbi:hypothetical protein DL96DRAFT_1774001 [Flagelloscypha sp. PMI_526]|nr:hypothetical protein DL96DRAFT_1774001 [Flagelloscypha sp. PMI_526]